MDWVFGTGGPMGPGGPAGPGGPWGPGGRRRGRRERGDVRAAILLLLAEQPRHGYEIITEISDRSDGAWQPSPGSVYPTLKRLAREGLVGPDTDDSGKRVFSLTDEGRAVVDAERESWGEPWAQAEADTESSADNVERTALWQEAQQLAAAVWQVSQLNQPDDLTAATEALAQARKAIYRRLAE